MKLSDQTLEVLKNFSDINTNILVKPGSELSTISTMKNILAKATITESFDKQFAVYDLSELLGIVSAIEKPDVDISNEKFMISLAIFLISFYISFNKKLFYFSTILFISYLVVILLVHFSSPLDLKFQLHTTSFRMVKTFTLLLSFFGLYNLNLKLLK